MYVSICIIYKERQALTLTVSYHLSALTDGNMSSCSRLIPTWQLKHEAGAIQTPAAAYDENVQALARAGGYLDSHM
jgi:hypothetical protein